MNKIFKSLILTLSLINLIFAESSANGILTCPSSITCSNDGNISKCRFTTYQNEEIWGPNTFEYYGKPLLSGVYSFKKTITPTNELLRLENVYTYYAGPACIYSGLANPEYMRYIIPSLGEARFQPFLNNQTQWILKDGESKIGECFNSSESCPVIEMPEIVVTTSAIEHQVNPFHFKNNGNDFGNRLTYEQTQNLCENKKNCVLSIIYQYKRYDSRNYLVGRVTIDISEPNKIIITKIDNSSKRQTLTKLNSFNVINIHEIK